jgi:UDP:flavonoid glycosyltransferase YjiC (YdhE family)
MRVLVSSWGWRSHFYPLVPLAWALRAAGHEVLVASQPGMTETIVGAGLPAVAVGADLDFAEVFGGRIGRVATRAERAGGAPAESVQPAVTPDGGVVRFAAATVADLVAFGREFGPDLVVFEPQNLAAAVTAAALGVPGVRQLWGPDETTQLDLDPATVLGPLAELAGVDVADVRPSGDLLLDPCPPGLQVRLAGPSAPVRYVPYNGPSVLPDWLRTPPSRPRVCLTGGTMMASLGIDSPLDLPAVIAELAGLDIELVLALHPAQHAGLTDLPDNVRLPRTPLALQLVLPTCQALIHQGGAGSMMTALAAGVAQLVVPLVSDQHFNAERLVAVGAGVRLPDGAGPAQVRQLVGELVADSPVARRATELADQIAAMPPPSQVVPVLERLCSGTTRSTARTEPLTGAHL